MPLTAQQKTKLYNATHTANTVGQIPTVEHFVVLVDKYMSYDDGYGDHARASMSTLNYLDYQYFDNEESLSAWIIEHSNEKNFKVFKVKPVAFELTAVLKLNT